MAQKQIDTKNPLGNHKVSIRKPLGNNGDINHLSGNESNTLNFLFQNCYNRGQRITGQITLGGITETLEISSKNVTKTTLTRLAKKGFITRKGGKRGNGGFGIYEIPEDIYQDLILNKVTIREPLGNHKVSHRVTSVSSSNSSINNTITTKKDENWLQEIQTPENLKTLGLGVNHIKQLKDKFFLSTEEIQQGLETFSYDLANGELERLKKRGIQNIIGYFFGAMKSGGYNSVKEDYISAEDLAEKEMIERLEKKKENRLEQKKRLEELLFGEWLETKSKEDLLKLEPPLVDYMDSFHKTALMEYFLSHEVGKFQKELQ